MFSLLGRQLSGRCLRETGGFIMMDDGGPVTQSENVLSFADEHLPLSGHFGSSDRPLRSSDIEPPGNLPGTPEFINLTPLPKRSL